MYCAFISEWLWKPTVSLRIKGVFSRELGCKSMRSAWEGCVKSQSCKVHVSPG